MEMILLLLVVWFIVSIPLAFLIGAVFGLSKSDEVNANFEPVDDAHLWGNSDEA